MMRLAAALVACLALAACEEESGAAAPGSFGPDLVFEQQAACEDDGGRWGAGGRPGTMVCYRETPDANNSCSSADDCSGVCFARSRTFSPVRPIFGCHDILTSLGAEATLCLE